MDKLRRRVALKIQQKYNEIKQNPSPHFEASLYISYCLLFFPFRFLNY